MDFICLVGRDEIVIENVIALLKAKNKIRLSEQFELFLGVVIEDLIDEIKPHNAPLINRLLQWHGMAHCEPPATAWPSGLDFL